jgi:ankyrin repeat protein
MLEYGQYSSIYPGIMKPVNIVNNTFPTISQETVEFVINNSSVFSKELEYSGSDGKRLIHYICQYMKLPMIMLIIKKGVDIDCATTQGFKPIHYIFKYQDKNTIKYIINNVKVNLKSPTNKGHTPLTMLSDRKMFDIINIINNK